MFWIKSKPKHSHTWHIIGIGPLVIYDVINCGQSLVYKKCDECNEYTNEPYPVPPEILALELNIPKNRIRII